MPASYVHQCVARDACRSMNRFQDEQLRAALTAGSEGPDPFFFSLFALPGTPSAPKLGSMMHTRRTDDFLVALARACTGSDITRAYCCGFFTHYGTDTTFHPFVYAHSAGADSRYSGTVHCTLEHGLEILSYRRRGHAQGVPVQMAGFARLTRSNKDRIARALHAALEEVFPEHRLGYARVRRSFDDAAGLCALLRSPSGRRYRALGAVAGLVGLDKALHAHMIPAEPPAGDIANDAHHEWVSPWAPQETRTDSFAELYTAAAARGTALVLAAESFMTGAISEDELRAITGAKSYDSGLPWQKTRPAHEVFSSGK